MRTTNGKDGQDAPSDNKLWEAHRYWGDNSARDELVPRYQPLLKTIAAKERTNALSITSRLRWLQSHA
jgi:DNA-directed RNA polymerase specialized sigma subunit